MSADNAKPAPAHLSGEAREFWAKIAAGWELDDAGGMILTVACEALDRMRGAQRLLKAEGLILKGRMHPAALIERDCRLAMLRSLRQLGLDLEPVREHVGRPAGGK